jgi:glycosyltransferase involved in cell wall biosynthesis
LKSLSVSLGLNRIEFSGGLHGEEKWQAYADADLFVLPTHSENFGMSVAEALASGTPALVSKGAPWSGLEKEVAGRWIEIGLEPLIAGLEEMLGRDIQEFKEMGNNGRNWMIKDFSWLSIGQQMSDLYKWLAKESDEVPSFVKFS